MKDLSRRCHLTPFELLLRVKKIKSRGVDRQRDPTVLYLTMSICPGGPGKKSMGLREAVRGLITFRRPESRSNR